MKQGEESATVYPRPLTAPLFGWIRIWNFSSTCTTPKRSRSSSRRSCRGSSGSGPYLVTIGIPKRGQMVNIAIARTIINRTEGIVPYLKNSPTVNCPEA